MCDVGGGGVALVINDAKKRQTKKQNRPANDRLSGNVSGNAPASCFCVHLLPILCTMLVITVVIFLHLFGSVTAARRIRIYNQSALNKANLKHTGSWARVKVPTATPTHQ